MKYRLKDRELQAKLDEISGGDFSHQLKLFANPDGDFHIAFGQENDEGLRRFCASFSSSDIEKTPEYTPNAWNEWPAVTPPEGPLMRLEYNDQIGAKRKACATYFNGEWISFDGFKIEPRNARFRPWEDE